MTFSSSFAFRFTRLSVLVLATVAHSLYAARPSIGQKAPDFTLPSINGDSVRLSDQLSKGPVVLIVLRGYPGYQCPFCNRQAQDFISSANDFAGLGASVLLVYPGPEKDLAVRAAEFMTDKKLPDHFKLALDPGFAFTNQYGLRWDAKNETAYPSTFLIDSDGTIFFMWISTSHGGRAQASSVLDQLKKRAGAK